MNMFLKNQTIFLYLNESKLILSSLVLVQVAEVKLPMMRYSVKITFTF